MARPIGKKATIEIGDGTESEAFDEIANLDGNLSFPFIEVVMKQTDPYGSAVGEQAPTMHRIPNFSISIAEDPGDTGHARLRTLLTTKAAGNFKFVYYKSVAGVDKYCKVPFTAYISSMPMAPEKAGHQMTTVNFAPTGDLGVVAVES